MILSRGDNQTLYSQIRTKTRYIEVGAKKRKVYINFRKDNGSSAADGLYLKGYFRYGRVFRVDR